MIMFEGTWKMMKPANRMEVTVANCVSFIPRSDWKPWILPGVSVFRTY